MNNMNKARIRTAWTFVATGILSMVIGNASGQAAEMHRSMSQSAVVYKRTLFVDKYTNLVSIKDVINIDLGSTNSNEVYTISDLSNGTTFKMPDYSKELNLNSRVDSRVIISRLANAILSQETGGVNAYYRKSYSSSACGAFQYMSTSWDNFMGYKSACDAPEWVQDQRMIDELKSSYATYHDWRMAVAAHLSPSRAGNMATWNRPVPGNPTVNQYVRAVFKKANIAY